MKRKKLLVVGPMTGGVGKSTTSAVIAELISSIADVISVIDADAGNSASGKVHLDLILTHLANVTVTAIGIGPGEDGMRANKNAAVEQWSQSRSLCLTNDAVITDLGANQLSDFAAYLESALPLFEEDNIDIILFVPVTARGSAAAKDIEGLKLWSNAVPGASVVVINNEMDGPVPTSLPLLAAINDIFGAVSGKLVLPACASRGTDPWNRLELLGLSPFVAAKMHYRVLSEKLNSVPNTDPLLIDVVAYLQRDIKKWIAAIEAAGWRPLLKTLLS